MAVLFKYHVRLKKRDHFTLEYKVMSLEISYSPFFPSKWCRLKMRNCHTRVICVLIVGGVPVTIGYMRANIRFSYSDRTERTDIDY